MYRYRKGWRAVTAAMWAALLASLWAIWALPSGTAASGVARSNVRVTRDGFAAHAEPALAVNPHNPRNLLGAVQLLGVGTAPTRIGAFASFDGGRTWRQGGPLPFPAGANTGDDVTVAFDAQGTGFVCAMATRESRGQMSQDRRGVYIWRTGDGGRTFQPPVAVTQGVPVDHPWLAIDTGPGPGQGTLYVVWRGAQMGLSFSRSTDGGRSFSAPRTISLPQELVVAPVVAAGPAGSVYVTYGLWGAGTGDTPREDDAVRSSASPGPRRPLPPLPPMSVAVVASTDQGRHFSPPVSLASVPVEITAAPDQRLPSGLDLAVDRRTGTVYLVYAAARGTGSAIMLRRSQDHGRTWSAPVALVGGGSGQRFAFQAQVVVDDADLVDVSCYTLTRGRVQVLLARRATHGSGSPATLTVTSSPFDPTLGPPGGKHGRWWLGDYQGLATGGGWIYLLWGDTRTGRLDTFAAAAPATRL
jgi:hypothetical protein